MLKSVKQSEIHHKNHTMQKLHKLREDANTMHVMITSKSALTVTSPRPKKQTKEARIRQKPQVRSSRRSPRLDYSLAMWVLITI